MKINLHLNFVYFYIKILERDGFKILSLLDDLDIDNIHYDIISTKDIMNFDINLNKKNKITLDKNDEIKNDEIKNDEIKNNKRHMDPLSVSVTIIDNDSINKNSPDNEKLTLSQEPNIVSNFYNEFFTS
jgi:hypothetical protein